MQEANNTSPAFTLSIVIPVYNEEVSINEVIKTVLKTPYQKEIIVVDDGSTDGTRDKILKIDHPEVRVILHEENIGKGGGLYRQVLNIQTEMSS